MKLITNIILKNMKQLSIIEILNDNIVINAHTKQKQKENYQDIKKRNIKSRCKKFNLSTVAPR